MILVISFDIVAWFPMEDFLLMFRRSIMLPVEKYLDMEVKKHGADYLHRDVSYKEAKHLCRYKGKSVFKGLVTAMNNLREICLQFHVYSDSYEQMTSVLEAFRETTCSLGLPAVRLFYTYHPAGDKQYYMGMLPSLHSQQDVFDALSSPETEQLDLGGKQSLTPYPYAKISSVRVAADKQEIDKVIMALKEDMTEDKI